VGADVCDVSTDARGESVTFHFLLEEGGNSVGQTTWDGGTEGTGYDMVGPRAPDAIRVGIGDLQLAIGLIGIGEESDRNRFEAFCVPEGTGVVTDAGLGSVSTGTAADAAASQDAGLDASAGLGTTFGADAGDPFAAPDECATPLLRAGERPPAAYACGSTGETARTLLTRQLSNGVNYAVGVAAKDIVGNRGPLSAIECGRPIPLDDFYELYSRSGGLGGGGFCSVPAAGPTRRERHVPLWALALGVLMIARRSRRAAR
jgi:hypothetical protein